MSTCSISELIDASCANGFFALAHEDQVAARGVELQLFKDIAGTDATIGQLISDACNNGFMCLAQSNEMAARATILQLLCDIAEG